VKYVLWICVDPTIPVDPADNDIDAWLASVGDRRLEGHELRGVGDATTVRDRGRLVSDGPFAETKELIAGYDVIECAGLDEAVEIAAAHPVARFGAVEVRPVWE
jgi:hypothetical protein